MARKRKNNSNNILNERLLVLRLATFFYAIFLDFISLTNDNLKAAAKALHKQIDLLDLIGLDKLNLQTLHHSIL